MYIFKNAWTSIIRNKGRNILIGIVIVVIAAACAITLSIVNSANKIVKAYEDKYQVKASISMNRDYLMQQLRSGDKSQEEMINAFNEIEQVKLDDIDKFGDSDYVKDYYYTYSLGVNADGLSEATDQLMKETTETKIERKKTTTEEGSSGGGGGMGPGGGGDAPGVGGGGKSTSTEETTTSTTRTEKVENMRAQDGAFTLIGYSSYSAMSDFVSGSYTITDGSVSSNFTSNTCVVSKELADLNSLTVGSVITLVDTKDTTHTYQLEVTGIYTENTEESQDMSNMFSNSANNIITNVTVLENIIAGNSNLTPVITPTFVLNNSESLDGFKAEVSAKGLSEYYTVSDNLNEVSSATEGVDNVGTFALTFLFISLIIGAVVLFTINMINIRERKYEIGVLRTIGMSKLKVIWQFILELLIVALVALLIGAVIGAASSVSVANKLLESEIENTQTQMQTISSNFGGGMDPGAQGGPDAGGPGGGPGGGGEKFGGVANVNQINDINAVVDFVVLLELLGLGLALSLVSSSSACIAIARFSPLEILRERS